MPECSGIAGWATCQVEGAVGAAVDSGAESLGQAMMGAWDDITKSFLTSWLNVGLLVDLDAGSITWLTAQLQVISVLLATVGLMVAAVWTMVHHRGEKAVKVAKSLFTVTLVTTVGVALVQVVITGGDAFSDWILDSAGVTVETHSQQLQAAVAASPGLSIIAGIFGVVATMIQWGIMLVRSALLPLLIGVWPAAAAASMIGGAEQAFSKITVWIIAFVLYKPVAAIVYAYAWKTKSGIDGIGGVVNGLILIVLAVVALPAMMRLLAPGTSALGGSGGGSLAMAGGAALVGAGVAAGTAVLTGGGSAAAGGAAKTASTAKSTQSAMSAGPSTAKGAESAGPTGPGGSGSGSGGGSPAGGGGSGGSGSGGTGSGTVGGASTAGGADAETVGSAGAANGSGGARLTGAGTVGGASTARGTGDARSSGSGSAGPNGAAEGASQPPTGTAGTTGSGGPAGTAAGTTSGQPSKTKQAGAAATHSLGQAVANGAKDADGKDVIGE